MNKKVIELEKVINNAITEIKQAFDEVKTEIVEVDQPEYKTVKRDAKAGEQILITNPSLVNAGEKGEVFTVTDNYEGFVDVEEIRATSNHWAFMPHEYEVITELEQVPVTKELTPNQQRAELIERAKEFVELHSSRVLFNEFEFVVNPEKRTVVALIRDIFNGNVVSRGIAKCMPDEVFNEWIGRAIALARVLDIDVPEEFLNAVQPDEVVVGMKVKATSHVFESSFNHVVDIHSQFSVQQNFSQPNRSWFAVIINDTNAIYGGNPQ